jgi:Fe-S-cluster containining protein
MTAKEERAVPCGSCQACCRREWIVLDPAAGDILELYATEDVFDPRTGRPVKALAHKPNGDCFYLAADGCSIHGHRPYLCRIFDCRLNYREMMKMPAGDRRRALRANANAKEMFEIGREMEKKFPTEGG